MIKVLIREQSENSSLSPALFLGGEENTNIIKSIPGLKSASGMELLTKASELSKQANSIGDMGNSIYEWVKGIFDSPLGKFMEYYGMFWLSTKAVNLLGRVIGLSKGNISGLGLSTLVNRYIKDPLIARPLLWTIEKATGEIPTPEMARGFLLNFAKSSGKGFLALLDWTSSVFDKLIGMCKDTGGIIFRTLSKSTMDLTRLKIMLDGSVGLRTVGALSAKATAAGAVLIGAAIGAGIGLYINSAIGVEGTLFIDSVEEDIQELSESELIKEIDKYLIGGYSGSPIPNFYRGSHTPGSWAKEDVKALFSALIALKSKNKQKFQEFLGSEKIVQIAMIPSVKDILKKEFGVIVVIKQPEQENPAKTEVQTTDPISGTKKVYNVSDKLANQEASGNDDVFYKTDPLYKDPNKLKQLLNILGYNSLQEFQLNNGYTENNLPPKDISGNHWDNRTLSLLQRELNNYLYFRNKKGKITNEK